MMTEFSFLSEIIFLVFVSLGYQQHQKIFKRGYEELTETIHSYLWRFERHCSPSLSKGLHNTENKMSLRTACSALERKSPIMWTDLVFR